jgi:polyhydroxybutyrate depolymerase
MHTKWLSTLGFGLTIGIIGCGSSTPSDSGGTGGSTPATGGRASGGSSTVGGSSSGGSSAGGSANGGTGTGGTATGGTGTGGTGTGGTATGGTASGGKASGGTSAGGSSSGGSAMGGSSSGGGGSGTAVPSKGCGNKDGLKTLTTGGMSVASGLATSTKLKITSGGSSRDYIIDVPADYDPSHPYRLIFSWHQAYGSATGNANGLHPANDGPNFNAKNYAFFGLQRESTAAKQPAIFIAPQGIGDFPWDYNRDVVLFDNLLALVDENLCIDDSRVFTTGFSFGAMMSYALSVGRASKLRGAVTMAAANYNFTQPTNAHTAVAYFGITGMSDTTCPWGSDTQGGKACVLQHAKDNGCTIPGSIQTTTVGSKKYLCYDFEGCKAGYPVKVCTFDGPHTPSAVDDGSSTGDDGLKAFVPPLAWKFMAQF